MKTTIQFLALIAAFASTVPLLLAQLSPGPAWSAWTGVTGAVERHFQFRSAFVEPRNVDVWLPPGYDLEPVRRYPVLYMHDGQNLFDPGLAYSGLDWDVDGAMTRLLAEGKVPPAIVVGIWNSPRRVGEYMPQKAVQISNSKDLAGIPHATADPIVSDLYLKFLVTELKPFIDARYRTLPGPAHTSIMGSSMGGLISLYALCEYPDVFGGAGCVSTHWPAGDGAVIDYLRTRLPDPKTHRLYFDFGTATLDARYEPYQLRADEVVKGTGYTEGVNWITRKFEGAEHSERSWRERVHVPLIFLLSAQAAPAAKP